MKAIQMRRVLSMLVALCGLNVFTPAAEAALDIAQIPLFIGSNVPPLNMLVMGRDHKLYYEAYNDASDLNGDGRLDVGYKPLEIDYYGYFDSYTCYTYTEGSSGPFIVAARHSPGTGAAPDRTQKRCPGQWSGDFLNYVTTSRIDALRKVLYGGYRDTDTATQTILKRSYIPRNGHSFGKEYQSIIRDGYDIRDYTPISLPDPGRYHLFANLSTSRTGPPLLRLLKNNTHRIWNWISIEASRTAGENNCTSPSNVYEPCTPGITEMDGSISRTFRAVSPHSAEYEVLVQVCPGAALGVEENCKRYPSGAYKPTGLLHDYAENNSMYFGLLTGSFKNSQRGGVLRRNVVSLIGKDLNGNGVYTDAGEYPPEIDTNNGQFLSVPSGIIANLNALKIAGFDDTDYVPDVPAGSAVTCPFLQNRSANNGECPDWGNPIAEMMYETMRYFSGAPAATPEFVGPNDAPTGNIADQYDTNLGLTTETWRNPFTEYPTCARPFQTVISDINPSYDTGLPGNAFGETPPTDIPSQLASFNASTVANSIWSAEGFGSSENIFIGQSGAVDDGAPTVKTASGFSDIRGLSPEEPTKKGSYYSAAVSYYGRTNDISAAANPVSSAYPGGQPQNIRTYAVAIASPLPRIEFPLGSGRKISLIPFAKTVGPSATSGYGCGGVVDGTVNGPRATNTIVDFYVEQVVNFTGVENAAINGGRPYAVFRINYEDVEQGNDHDLDAITRYTLAATSTGSVTVDLHNEYAQGSCIQHMGYVISGTTADGVYLDIRDLRSTETPPTAPPWALGGPATEIPPDMNLIINYMFNTPPGLSAGACRPPSAAAACANGLPVRSSRTFTPGVASGARFLKDPLWYAAKYGGFNEADSTPGPNLPIEWDTDANGVPDNYFLVTNALNLKQQLRNAFGRISGEAGNSGGINVTGVRVDTGSLSYIPRYSPEGWVGDLEAYEIDPNTGTPGALNWKASDALPAFATRTIVTVTQPGYGGTGPTRTLDAVNFDEAGLGGGALAEAALGFSSGEMLSTYPGVGMVPPASITDVINYLRGDATRERRNTPNGLFRDRMLNGQASPIGPIIGSEPELAGNKDDFGYAGLAGLTGENTYAAFVASKSARIPVVYVGANDGMLHAFDSRRNVATAVPPAMPVSTGGREMFAFIPSAARRNLKALLSPSYVHQYYVDGSARTGDAYLGGTWKTVLVSSVGAGGRSIFALDVTTPLGFDATKVLWELTEAQDPDIGTSIGVPAIAVLPGNQWVAIFGNGYNSASHRSALFVVDLATGTILRKIMAGTGTAAAPNGMGNIIAVDSNNDGFADTVYGGDYKGNVWKFDVSATTAAGWSLALSGSPLFTARDPSGTPQRITGGLEASGGPDGGILVYFGTGQYFLNGDNAAPTASSQIESLYAIWDRNAAITYPTTAGGRDSVLQRQTIDVATATARTLSTNAIDFQTKRGWYLDLANPVSSGPVVGSGERFVGTPILVLGQVIFTTFGPTGDLCSPGGRNWLNGLNALSGAASSGGSQPLVNGPPVRRPAVVVPSPGDPPGLGSNPIPLPAGCTVAGACPTPPMLNPATVSRCSLVVLAPGASPITLRRPCGRQSWRQVD
jgi:type IV pilus assembly protein PilY1